MLHLLEKPASILICGIFIIKLSSCEDVTADLGWSYEDQESWNIQCGGSKQSPIDIPRRGCYVSFLEPSAIPCPAGLPEAEFPALEFSHYNTAPGLLKIRNTGEIK